MNRLSTRQQLLLIREMPGQAGANDCCGKMTNDPAQLASEEEFLPWIDGRKRMGELYNAVRERFDPDEVDITMIDPRAQIVMWFKLAQHVWWFRPSGRQAMGLLLQRFSIPAVIVNGRVISTDNLPTPDQLLAELRRDAWAATPAS